MATSDRREGPTDSSSSPRPVAPGDEATPGTPGTGEDVCPRCGGSGRLGANVCPECEGSGRVVKGIGGG